MCKGASQEGKEASHVLHKRVKRHHMWVKKWVDRWLPPTKLELLKLLVLQNTWVKRHHKWVKGNQSDITRRSRNITDTLIPK